MRDRIFRGFGWHRLPILLIDMAALTGTVVALTHNHGGLVAMAAVYWTMTIGLGLGRAFKGEEP